MPRDLDTCVNCGRFKGNCLCPEECDCCGTELGHKFPSFNCDGCDAAMCDACRVCEGTRDFCFKCVATREMKAVA